MHQYVVPAVLTVSILIQIASAVTALFLVRKSGAYLPWIFIATAITLMAVRRIISLRNIFVSGAFPASSLGPELVALLISILMFTGLLLFRPFFRYIRRMQEESNRKVKEKEMMVKESHHHIKNDLQMLSGLVRLQESSFTDTNPHDFYKDLELRIQTFTLLHEFIYSSGKDGVSFVDYIQKLSSAIGDAYDCDTKHVEIRNELEELAVERRALRLLRSHPHAEYRGELGLFPHDCLSSLSGVGRAGRRTKRYEGTGEILDLCSSPTSFPKVFRGLKEV